MARIAKELGVPAAIIGRMVVTAPDDMVWLTPQDLQSMGTTMVGKPNQTLAARSFPPDQALQQTPDPPFSSMRSKSSERPSSDDDKPPPTWGELLEKAIQLSKKQNRGTPDFNRVCQPELKTCTNGLGFTANDGTNMIMKVTENLDGQIIRREICSFNPHHDIRSCVDWDKGTTHRDMKKAKGDWEQVSE
jgi:hypothetical protein